MSSVEFQWPCVDAVAFVCNLPSLFYYSADVFSADVCDELMVLVPSLFDIFVFLHLRYATFCRTPGAVSCDVIYHRCVLFEIYITLL